MATVREARENGRAGADRPLDRVGLPLVRVTIGAVFVWVFFENLGKDLCHPSNYAGPIKGYIENGSSPEVWKHGMTFMANHAAIAAPQQGITEISLGVLVLLGLLTRPVALVAFAFLGSLWMSELGSGWIWESLVPDLASLSLAIGAAGRTCGLDSNLARGRPNRFLW
jgi:uncharacterized membrane protein YphA (DoxX/SURF4 family)